MDAQDPFLEALVPALADRLPDLLTEVRSALRGEWPDYADFLVEHDIEVGVAADAALRRLITMAGTHPGEEGVDTDLFEEIGRIQWRQGRDLSALLAAFQVGARVCWHHVSAAAVDVGVGPRTLASLAEAVFFFVDRLSSSAARGYVLEQSEAAATRERMREELVGLLLSDRADQAAVAAAAARAGWTVPDEVGVVLIRSDSAVGHRVLARMDSSCLVFSRPPLFGAIVPCPSRPGLRRRLGLSLRGAGAVVGVPVAPDRLPASLHIAEIAARLQIAGVLSDDPVFTDEHLDAIIVHRDSRLLDALRAQVLAPLDEATPASRDRLVETLAAWLRHMGDRQAIAADLHVHPQTVRYRLAKLHELYGPDLDDPQLRSRLSLALSWGETHPQAPPGIAVEPQGQGEPAWP